MKQRYCIAFLFAAVFGTALHFAYTLLPVLPVGFFAPVRESVWEHLKLLYWPVLLAGIFLCRGKPDQRRAWAGLLTAILLMPAVLLGIRYTLLAGFAFQSPVVDIALYYLVLAGGFRLAYRMEQQNAFRRIAEFAVIPVGLLGAALVLFTPAPPSLPVFLAGN